MNMHNDQDNPVQIENIRKLLHRCYEYVEPAAGYDKRLFKSTRKEYRRALRDQGVTTQRFILLPMLALAAIALLSVLYLGDNTLTPRTLTREEKLAQIHHLADSTNSPSTLLQLAHQAETLNHNILCFDLLSRVAKRHPNYLSDQEKMQVLPSLGYQYLDYHFSANPNAPTFHWEARSQWLRGENLSDAKDMEYLYQCEINTPECQILDAVRERVVSESGMTTLPHSVAVFDHYIIVLQVSDSSMSHSLLRYYDHMLSSVYDTWYSLAASSPEASSLPRHGVTERHRVYLYRDTETWQANRDRLQGQPNILHGVYDKSDPASIIRGAVSQLLQYTMPSTKTSANVDTQNHWAVMGLQDWFAGYDYQESSGDFTFGRNRERLRTLAAETLRQRGATTSGSYSLASLLTTSPTSQWQQHTTLQPLAWATTMALLQHRESADQYFMALQHLRSGRDSAQAFHKRMQALLQSASLQTRIDTILSTSH